MKKIYLTLLTLLSFFQITQAQWTGSPGNIYYNTGNVGIGNTAPTTALQIGAGTALSFNNGAGTPTISQVINSQTSGTAITGTLVNDGVHNFRIAMFADDTNLLTGIDVTGTSTNPSFVIRDSNLEFLRILNNGNIGIGTTNPTAKLEVSGSFLTTGARSITINPLTGNITAQGSSNGGWAETFGFIGSAGTDHGGFGAVGNTDAFTRYYIGTYNTDEKISILASGNIGIGTTAPDQKLSVNGTIHSKSVVVDLNGWSDFVFKPAYHLRPLAGVKTYIEKNHHLPDVPAAAEVEKNGLDVGKMNKILIQKVEELTLYLIEKDKQLNSQQNEFAELSEHNRELQQQLKDLAKKVAQLEQPGKDK